MAKKTTYRSEIFPCIYIDAFDHSYEEKVQECKCTTPGRTHSVLYVEKFVVSNSQKNTQVVVIFGGCNDCTKIYNQYFI